MPVYTKIFLIGGPNVPNTYKTRYTPETRDCQLEGPLNRGGFKRGGVSNGGASRSGLVLPFLSFSVLFGTFPIFDLLGDGPGIFPICPFPLPRPIKSTYEEQSRKGPRHNLDLSPKRVGNPPVWKPLV